MRLTLGARAFVAVSLALVTILVIGLGAVRWRIFDAPIAAPIVREEDRLAPLVDDLAKHYVRRGDWSFLPATASARQAWLRDQWGDLSARVAPTRDDAGLASSLGFRLGLIDRDGHSLAGAVPHPVLVAAISTDVARLPIVVAGESVGYLVLIKAGDARHGLAMSFLVDQQRNLAWIAALALVSGALAAAVLGWHFRRPIQRMVAGARLWQRAHWDTRLDAARGDELGELARAFNGMAATLEAAELDRRRWVSDTSHELRTPLAVLRAQLEALEAGVRAATPDNLALMRRQVLSLSELVDDLHALASADEGRLLRDLAPFDLWPLVIEAAAAQADRLAQACVSCRLAAAPAQSRVLGDVARLRQVLGIVLDNGAHHVAAEGRIDISNRVVDDELQLIVDDTGPGVSADLLPRLGERFFRVEASRNRADGGAGLGLALARRIAEAHHGRLIFAASPLGGLRVTLTLPLVATP